MNKSQKPLMLAYILFLIVSLIYHAISSIFGFEFLAWDRILVATTIASYAFSCSSASKFFIKIDTNTLDFAKKHLELSKQLKCKEQESIVEKEKKKAILESGQQVIDCTIDIILKTEKDIKKRVKQAFWCDVIGYLMFFCIITISPIYVFLASGEEIFTLIAFVLILLIEYAESTYVIKIENSHEALLNSVKSSIKHIDEYNEQHNPD